MAIPDIFKQRAQSENWDLNDAAKFTSHQTVEADVIIIGTGAGGGVSAEVLSQAGLKVVMIEEGGLHTSDDFNMDELEALPNLYQEGRYSLQLKMAPLISYKAAQWVVPRW